MIRRALAGVGILLSLAACSPAQFQVWKEWHREDPQEAARWAAEECGALCTDDWDQDGVVEPEPDEESQGSSAAEDIEADEAALQPEPEYDGDEGGQDTGGVYWPWTELAQCESGGNWAADTGNGYYGGLQFAWGSWEAAGGSGNPAHASPSEQVARAETLQDMQGWGAWPTCARIVGLL
jgi:hypothetical protein